METVEATGGISRESPSLTGRKKHYVSAKIPMTFCYVVWKWSAVYSWRCGRALSVDLEAMALQALLLPSRGQLRFQGHLNVTPILHH